MRDLQETIWFELKSAVEAYVKALEENTDLDLITALSDKIKELELRLSKIKACIAGVVYTFQRRPEAIVKMHLREAPDYV